MLQLPLEERAMTAYACHLDNVSVPTHSSTRVEICPKWRFLASERQSKRKRFCVSRMPHVDTLIWHYVWVSSWAEIAMAVESRHETALRRLRRLLLFQKNICASFLRQFNRVDHLGGDRGVTRRIHVCFASTTVAPSLTGHCTGPRYICHCLAVAACCLFRLFALKRPEEKSTGDFSCVRA